MDREVVCHPAACKVHRGRLSEVPDKWLVACRLAVDSLKSIGFVTQSEVQGVVLLTLGLVRTESNFGSSRRYRAKSLISRAALCTKAPMHLAIGEAQVSRARVETLRLLFSNAGLGLSKLPAGPRESALAAAMGLAVGLSLYNPTKQLLELPLARALAITHNCGWLGPRNAALQMLLTDLLFLQSMRGPGGFCGETTQRALLNAATTWDMDPPKWVTGSTSQFRFVMHAVEHYSDVSESRLIRRCREAWEQRFQKAAPHWIEPSYSFRPWHGGWIRSAAYASSATVFFRQGL
jgi:hypothetical protein